MRSRVAPLPSSTEGTVIPENQVEEDLLRERNVYDGNVHNNGK
jgi:hypothetical protein